MTYGSAPFGSMPFGESLEDFPPWIGNWLPFAGAQITRLTAIEFDVLDDFGLEDTHVRAVFPAGVIESVFAEAGGFAENYQRGSGRKAIDGGFHYALRRTGGWPSASVRIDVTATDIAGQVGTGQASFP